MGTVVREIPLVFNLSNVNIAEATGVLKIRKSHLSKGKTFNVTLSGGLLGKIKASMRDNKKMKYTNVDFESLNASPEYKENPLKLIHFIKDGASSYLVQLVDDKGFYFKEYLNAMNQRADKIVFRHWKKSQYLRYWVVDQDNR